MFLIFYEQIIPQHAKPVNKKQVQPLHWLTIKDATLVIFLFQFQDKKHGVTLLLAITNCSVINKLNE